MMNLAMNVLYKSFWTYTNKASLVQHQMHAQALDEYILMLWNSIKYEQTECSGHAWHSVAFTMSFYIFIMPYYYIYIEFFTYIIAQLLFLWTADLREIYAKLFRKNYKLFLWIADLREIYAKLFKKITNYFYGLQISAKYMPIFSKKITKYFYGL